MAVPPAYASPPQATAPPASTVLERRIQHLLDLRTDTPAMRDALQSIATLAVPMGGGAPIEAVRRTLRSAVEARALEVVDDFLSRVEPVAAAVEALEAQLASVEAACDAAAARIQRSERDTSAFLAATAVLADRKADIVAKLSETRRFLAEYELSDAELRALGTVADGSGDCRPFFDALARVGTVVSKCFTLLGGPRHDVALQLSDAANREQAAGLTRLYEWCQAQCRDPVLLAAMVAQAGGGGHAGDDEDDSGGGGRAGRLAGLAALRTGLVLLQRHRPSFLRSCQEAAAGALRTLFIRRFLRALTGLGAVPGGAVAAGADAAVAIDATAHDPVRYVGDMLAWLHVNVTEDQDLVATLFYPPSTPAATVGSSVTVAVGEEEAGADAARDGVGEGEGDGVAPLPLACIMATVTEGVVRPLSLRLEQAIAAAPSVPAAYRIVDVLSFYLAALTPLLTRLPPSTPMAPMLQTLVTGRDGAVAAFRSQVSSSVDRLRFVVGAFPVDLGVHAAVAGVAVQLDEMLKVAAGAIGMSGTEGDDGGGADVDAAVVAMVQAAVDACRRSSEGLRLVDRAVFMLNNVAALRQGVEPHAREGRGGTSSLPHRTPAWMTQLHTDTAMWAEALVQHSANDVLTSCGMLSALAQVKAGGTVGVGCPPPPWSDAVHRAGEAFVQSVASPALFAAHDKVVFPALRDSVRRDTASVLTAAYAALYAAVSEAAGGDAGGPGMLPSTLLPHTPDRVALVLTA